MDVIKCEVDALAEKHELNNCSVFFTLDILFLNYYYWAIVFSERGDTTLFKTI